jgi:hypothetical protein
VLPNLMTGLAVMLLCLLLQAAFIAMCLRLYSRLKAARRGPETRLEQFGLLALVMLQMQAGNLVQVAIWGALFLYLGEFADYPTAIYHSGVNYAGLGYGDIVMSEQRRLLGPLEAANGILMFGVSTAVMTAAVMDVIQNNKARLDASAPRRGDGRV